MYMKALAEEWKKRDREREIIMKKKVMLWFNSVKEREIRERDNRLIFCSLVYTCLSFERQFTELHIQIEQSPVKQSYSEAGRAIKVIVSNKFIKNFID